MTNVNKMTRKQFEELPEREKWNDVVICDSIVMIPGKSRPLHDSGYRCIDFVAVKDDVPICRLSGCSDVVHIDGIGGYGFDWLNKYRKVPSLVEPSGWNIDCLPKSGLFRMWCNGEIACGPGMSSFEIERKERKIKE